MSDISKLVGVAKSEPQKFRDLARFNALLENTTNRQELMLLALINPQLPYVSKDSLQDGGYLRPLRNEIKFERYVRAAFIYSNDESVLHARRISKLADINIHIAGQRLAEIRNTMCNASTQINPLLHNSIIYGTIPFPCRSKCKTKSLINNRTIHIMAFEAGKISPLSNSGNVFVYCGTHDTLNHKLPDITGPILKLNQSAPNENLYIHLAKDNFDFRQFDNLSSILNSECGINISIVGYENNGKEINLLNNIYNNIITWLNSYNDGYVSEHELPGLLAEYSIRKSFRIHGYQLFLTLMTSLIDISLDEIVNKSGIKFDLMTEIKSIF